MFKGVRLNNKNNNKKTSEIQQITDSTAVDITNGITLFHIKLLPPFQNVFYVYILKILSEFSPQQCRCLGQHKTFE